MGHRFSYDANLNKYEQVLYDYIFTMVNRTPYRWGGDDPLTADKGGVDCSGFVILLLQTSGVLPSRYDATAQSLYYKFRSNAIDFLQIKFGSLLFYGRALNEISHVGFALNNFHVVHSSGGNSLLANSRNYTLRLPITSIASAGIDI